MSAKTDDERPMLAASERLARVGQRAGAVAGCGAVVGGVWVTAAGRAQFHRHVVASGLTAGALAGFYFGERVADGQRRRARPRAQPARRR